MSLIQVSNLTFGYEGSYHNIFENVSFIESGDGYKYTGDYLDPNAEHDTKELYSKYGYLNLRFFMDSGDYSDFKELVKDVADIMQANDMPYNKMRVYMYFKDSDVIFCEGNYTAEEIKNHWNGQNGFHTYLPVIKKFD